MAKISTAKKEKKVKRKMYDNTETLPKKNRIGIGIGEFEMHFKKAAQSGVE